MTSSSLFQDSNSNALTADECEVVLWDSTSISANLISYDQISGGLFQNSSFANSDLALIQLDNVEDGVCTLQNGTSITLPQAVSFEDSDALAFGEECFTIATLSDGDDDLTGILDTNIVSNPHNTHESNFYTTTLRGSTNFFDGSFDYLIQTGITTHSGYQGAPLFNAQGKVIGVINLRAEKTTRYDSNDPYGISFATPSDAILSYLNEKLGLKIPFDDVSYFNPSIIKNTDDINKANDSVSNYLMNDRDYGSDDYYVASSEADIIIDNAGTAADDSDPISQKIADRNLNKTVKLIVYSEEGISEGSGCIIDKNGYVLTNLHVVNKLSGKNESAGKEANSTVDVENISVYGIFENGTIVDGFKTKFVLFKMNLIAYNQQEDLAIVQFVNTFYHEDEFGTEVVSGKTVLQGFNSVVELKSSLPKTGEPVVAIGNALAYGISISTGIVSIPDMPSYKDIYGYNMIQTDCPINGGNSGGPLFDANGYVVGINTLGLSVSGYDNVSWAIPAQNAISFVEFVNNKADSDTVVIWNNAFKNSNDLILLKTQ